MWNRWLFLTCTLQLGGSTTRRQDRRSSAETRTTCSRLPPTTASRLAHEYEIAAHDIDYLVHYRGSSANAAAKTLNRAKGYSQRWMAETSYSTTKRSLGDAVRALGWYRQFREIVLMFAITNIEPLCEPL